MREDTFGKGFSRLPLNLERDGSERHNARMREGTSNLSQLVLCNMKDFFLKSDIMYVFENTERDLAVDAKSKLKRADFYEEIST